MMDILRTLATRPVAGPQGKNGERQPVIWSLVALPAFAVGCLVGSGTGEWLIGHLLMVAGIYALVRVIVRSLRS
jgi:hypothetical protein